MMQKNDAPKGQNKKDQEEDQVVAEHKVVAEHEDEDQHLRKAATPLSEDFEVRSCILT